MLMKNEIQSLTEDLQQCTNNQLFYARFGDTSCSRCTWLETKLSEKMQLLIIAKHQIKSLTANSNHLVQKTEELKKELASQEELHARAIDFYKHTNELSTQTKLADMFKDISEELVEDLTKAVAKVTFNYYNFNVIIQQWFVCIFSFKRMKRLTLRSVKTWKTKRKRLYQNSKKLRQYKRTWIDGAKEKSHLTDETVFCRILFFRMTITTTHVYNFSFKWSKPVFILLLKVSVLFDMSFIFLYLCALFFTVNKKRKRFLHEERKVPTLKLIYRKCIGNNYTAKRTFGQ